MILFNLSNTEQLPNMRGLSLALEFLNDCDETTPVGKVELDGKDVFAIIESYKTKQEIKAPRFEAHRKYIDIQFILNGSEIMGWAPLDSVSITEQYDEDKDILFGTVEKKARSFTSFSAGQAIMLFPSDAHAPGLAHDTPQSVKKVVIKIRQ